MLFLSSEVKLNNIQITQAAFFSLVASRYSNTHIFLDDFFASIFILTTAAPIILFSNSRVSLQIIKSNVFLWILVLCLTLSLLAEINTLSADGVASLFLVLFSFFVGAHLSKLPHVLLAFRIDMGVYLFFYIGDFLLFGQSNDNPLIYGYAALSMLPFVLTLTDDRRLIVLIPVLVGGILLLVVRARAAALSLFIFAFILSIKPIWHFCISNLRFILVSLVSFLLFITLTLSYIVGLGYLNSIDQFSVTYFGKNISARPLIWSQLVAIWENHPLFGNGIGVGSASFTDRRGLRDLSSHSTYLELLIRTGLVGLIGYISVIVLIAYRVVKIESSDQRAIMIFAYISCCLVFMFSAEFSIFNAMLPNYLFWMFIGVRWGGGLGKCRW